MAEDKLQIAALESKRCTKCGSNKSFAEFGARQVTKDGLQSNCKQCVAERSLNYFRKNREKCNQRSAKRYHQNKEQYHTNNARWMQENHSRRASYEKEYKAKNAARIKLQDKERRLRNKEKSNAQSREWRKKNPEKSLQLTHARRARMAGQGGRYTQKDIDRIRIAQRGKCAICRTELGSKFHRDHIIPISRGGSNSARNIQLTCDRCNREKHAKDPITFMQERGFLL